MSVSKCERPVQQTHPAAWALAATDQFDWLKTEELRCPVCGDDYIHISGVGARQQNDLTFIQGDGVAITKALPQDGRGSTLVAIFQGECGHKFAELTRFHKGNCFKQTVVFEGECSLDEAMLSGLWRD